MLTMVNIGSNRDAWGYLTETVASEIPADFETKGAYYLEHGTPPGFWLGKGSRTLKLDKDTPVGARELASIFGDGQDPFTGEVLGKKNISADSLEKRVSDRMVAFVNDGGVIDDEVIDRFYKEELERKVKQGVAGFEFVFSPPKSVSSWWALADPKTKALIEKEFNAAIKDTVEFLEQDIVKTRTGYEGVAQEDIKGLIAAQFTHWDSREQDPQLHAHVLVANRVQGVDGKWRTIDSRWSLSPNVATAGGHFDNVLMDRLSTRFGVEWSTEEVLKQPTEYKKWLENRGGIDSAGSRFDYSLDCGVAPQSVKWQISSVPQSLNDLFSKRAHLIRAEKDRLIADFHKAHGRKPTNVEIIKMRKQATLATRRKKQQTTLQALTATWRQKATPVVGDTHLFSDRVLQKGQRRLRLGKIWVFRRTDIDFKHYESVRDQILFELSNTRTTWGVNNVQTLAHHFTKHWRLTGHDDRRSVVAKITELVLKEGVKLTPEDPFSLPTRFMTDKGKSVFRPAVRDLYTTKQVFLAEQNLIGAGRTVIENIKVDAGVVETEVLKPTVTDGIVLSKDQAAAVVNIATSGRLVDVLVGPAGSGKTTSLEKLKEIWEQKYGAGSVKGLAPTAQAAMVLAESLGIQTENTAKWVYESTKTAGQKEKERKLAIKNGEVYDEWEFKLRPGQLLIVDESSIAGTMAVEELRKQAQTAGAKLLLVGDYAQLASVDAGGAFGLLANDRDDVAELTQLHRFKNDWEKEASLMLRMGKVDVLETYIEQGRIEWGLDENIVMDAVEAWKKDSLTIGKNGELLTSLLIAPTNDMVNRLNEIAQSWRIEMGQVRPGVGAVLETGVAYPGDKIVTRQNNRQIFTEADRWVRNNDEWEVIEILKDGSILAHSNGEKVLLPFSYVKENVQLAYAMTAHRSQGRTVDTSHTIVDSTSNRELFYVAMTRGKHSNKAYVIADEKQAIGDGKQTLIPKTPREVLYGVVANQAATVSAHEKLAHEAERVSSIRTVGREYLSISSKVSHIKYDRLTAKHNIMFEKDYDRDVFYADLRRLDTAGKLDEFLRVLPVGVSPKQAIIASSDANKKISVQRVCGLLEKQPVADDTVTQNALVEREKAIEIRAGLLVEKAIANNESWLKEVGQKLPGGEEDWYRRARTVAAYRDLYSVTTQTAVDDVETNSKQKAEHRLIAVKCLENPSVLPSNQSQTHASGIMTTRKGVTR